MRRHEVAAVIASHLLERNLLRISCENERWDYTSHRYVCAETGEPCPLLSPWRPFGRCPLEIAVKEVLIRSLTTSLEDEIARHLKIEAHDDITQAELPREISLVPPFVLRITAPEPRWRIFQVKPGCLLPSGGPSPIGPKRAFYIAIVPEGLKALIPLLQRRHYDVLCGGKWYRRWERWV